MNLYEKLLSKGKEVIEALELPFKVRKERKELEMKILELEQQLAKDDLTIQQEKSNSPIAWDKLLKAIDNKAINDRKLAQLQSLEKELFIDTQDEEVKS